jgi:cell division protein FtsQ
VLVVAAAAGSGLTYTGLFAADTISISGASGRSRSVLLAEAGLAPGVNVFHLDTAAAAAALASDPWIADAAVTVDLPSTIHVRVVERIPVAQADGVALAADGTSLPGARIAPLPSINAESPPLTQEQRRAAAGVIGALRAAQRRDVRAVSVGADGGFTIDLGTTVVRWGAADHNAEKVAALGAVLRSAAGLHTTPVRVDVSVPAAPSAIYA